MMVDERLGRELEEYQHYSIRIVQQSGYYVYRWTFLALAPDGTASPSFRRSLEAKPYLFRDSRTAQTASVVTKADVRPIAIQWSEARCKQWMRELVRRHNDGRTPAVFSQRPYPLESLTRFEAELTDDFDYVERRCCQ